MRYLRKLCKYNTPPNFVIGKSGELDIERLRQSYFSVIPNLDEFCVLMPRSSGEDEEPGRFPTEFVLYDPSNPERSFLEFVEAVQRVRENPRKAVVVNLMLGEVVYLKREPLFLFKVPLFDDTLDYKISAKQLKDGIPQGWNADIRIDVYIGNELFSSTDFSKPSNYSQRWSVLEEGVIAEMLKNQVGRLRRYFVQEAKGKGALEEYQIRLEFSVNSIPSNPVIGSTNVSFISRSHSYIDPNKGIINACWGLASKLVTKPDEVCIVEYSEAGLDFLVGTGNNWASDSLLYRQGKADVFDIEKKRITQVSTSLLGEEFCHLITSPHGIEDHAENIGVLTNHFSRKHGVPIELEGAWIMHDDETFYVFQRTKSYLLEDVIKELSHVENSRLVLSYPDSALGSINFKGNVVFYDPEKIEKGRLELVIATSRAYGSKVLLVATEFPDEILKKIKVDYVRMSSEQEVQNKLGFTKVKRTAAHVLGYLTSQLHKRRLRGENTCCVLQPFDLNDLATRNFGLYNPLRRDFNGAVEFKDVAVEATRGAFQIYFI